MTADFRSGGEAALRTAFRGLRLQVKELTRVSEDLLDETAALTEDRKREKEEEEERKKEEKEVEVDAQLNTVGRKVFMKMILPRVGHPYILI